MVPEKPALAYPAAVRALAGCFTDTARLLWRRRMHLPSQRVGTRLAENYARVLWRVLALVSVRGSIHYVVLPGLRRDVLLDNPRVLDGGTGDAAAWWRLAGIG